LAWAHLVLSGTIITVRWEYKANADVIAQLGQRSTYWPECCCEEDHEALQHPGLVEENIPRTEAFEALEA
jgi:hypothetical protein